MNRTKRIESHSDDPVQIRVNAALDKVIIAYEKWLQENCRKNRSFSHRFVYRRESIV